MAVDDDAQGTNASIGDDELGNGSSEAKLTDEKLKQELSTLTREELKQRIAEIESENVKLLHKLMQEKPQGFSRLVCESVLSTDSQNGISPERADPWQMDEWHRQRFGYLAALILRRLDADSEQQDIANKLEFCSLRSDVENHFYVTTSHHNPARYSSSQIANILREFFFQPIDSLSMGVAIVAEKIYRGVPLYCSVGDSGEYRLLPENDEEYVYIRQRGKRFEIVNDANLPDWAERYFVKLDHLRWYDIMFATDKILSEAEINERRGALRLQIGIPLGSETRQPQERESHPSKLFSVLPHVLKRYYGERFDPNDPDTIPTQATVVTWLREHHRLSEREALAVDLVTRPDVARRKP